MHANEQPHPFQAKPRFANAAEVLDHYEMKKNLLEAARVAIAPTIFGVLAYWAVAVAAWLSARPYLLTGQYGQFWSVGRIILLLAPIVPGIFILRGLIRGYDRLPLPSKLACLAWWVVVVRFLRNDAMNTPNLLMMMLGSILIAATVEFVLNFASLAADFEARLMRISSYTRILGWVALFPAALAALGHWRPL